MTDSNPHGLSHPSLFSRQLTTPLGSSNLIIHFLCNSVVMFYHLTLHSIIDTSKLLVLFPLQPNYIENIDDLLGFEPKQTGSKPVVLTITP